MHATWTQRRKFPATGQFCYDFSECYFTGMEKSELDSLRIELSLSAKNGLNFITAAVLVWGIITIIWTLPYSSYNKSVLTFISSGLMLPLAFMFSKIMKTSWSLKHNPLDPLGLWLNFAQLFYFPILVIVLLVIPDYFIATFVIITGAHFFPYAWFYKENSYAVVAGIAAIGGMLLSLILDDEQVYFIPLFMTVSLIALSLSLFYGYKKRLKANS